MVQLDYAQCAVLVEPVGVSLKTGDMLVLPKAADVHMTFAGDVGYGKVLSNYHGEAARRLRLVVRGKALGAGSVRLAEVHDHGRDNAAVLELLTVYGYRAEQMI